MADEEKAGKIHIDADWKTEAAKEKERLARAEQGTPAGTGAQAGTAGSPGFLEIVNLLAMQAAIALGGYQGPGGERIPPNAAAAKHHIDLLDVLEQKTKGNLTEDERRALDGVLYELRMQYVHAASGGRPRGAGG